jgi:phage recombination protein Bet
MGVQIATRGAAALSSLSGSLAKRFGMESSDGVIDILRATAFKGPANDDQLAALLIVATQYGLNPWTKEIYAFPDRNNGIVPVVGVDGWARIMNEHPQFDGLEFDQDDDGCTCRIFRKDRSRPIAVTEYMAECRRDGVGPWKSHPRRMLRHKAMIQCARLAFGFVGIYDQDEAERIREIDMGSAEVVGAKAAPALPRYSDSEFAEKLQGWRDVVESGKKTGAQIEAFVSSKYELTEGQRELILSLEITEEENAGA